MTNPFFDFTTDMPDVPTQKQCYSRCTNEACVDPYSPRLVPMDTDVWICGGCNQMMPPPYCAGELKRQQWLEYKQASDPSYSDEIEMIAPCEGSCYE